jgi:hypothetical protein
LVKTSSKFCSVIGGHLIACNSSSTKGAGVFIEIVFFLIFIFSAILGDLKKIVKYS